MENSIGQGWSLQSLDPATRNNPGRSCWSMAIHPFAIYGFMCVKASGCSWSSLILRGPIGYRWFKRILHKAEALEEVCTGAHGSCEVNPKITDQLGLIH